MDSQVKKIQFANEEYFLIFKNKTSFYVIQPLIDSNKKIFSFDDFTYLKNFNKFNIILGIKEGLIHFYTYVYDHSNKSLSINLNSILKDYKQVSAIDLSSNGSYMVFIQHPSINNNLKIYSIKESKTIFSVKSNIHPGSGNWPQIKFSIDERLYGRRNEKHIEIYDDSSNDHKEESFICLEDAFIYEFAYYNNETYIISIRTKTIEAKKTKKLVPMTMISLFKYPNLKLALNEITCSVAHRASIKVSIDGSIALIHSVSDESNKDSYYGNASLYYINLSSLKIKKISGLKDGPLHDFSFNSDYSKFFVISGHQPSVTYSFNSFNGELIGEVVSNLKVNQIRVSPNNNVICLFGGSSLRGDVYALDANTYKIIGWSDCFGTHSVEWSECGKILSSSVLSPYLNVDNDMKIMTYNCKLLEYKKFDENIYDSQWLGVNGSNVKYDKYEVEVCDEYKLKIEKDKSKNDKANTNKNGGNVKSSSSSFGGLARPMFFNSNKN